MFGNAVLANLADPRDCLSTSAESPLRMAARTRIRLFRSPQRVRVSSLPLRLKLRSVTLAAHETSDITCKVILRAEWRHVAREQKDGACFQAGHINSNLMLADALL